MKTLELKEILTQNTIENTVLKFLKPELLVSGMTFIRIRDGMRLVLLLVLPKATKLAE